MRYEIVNLFEKKIAEYAGAKYGVAVSSCTNAIFLCVNYIGYTNWSLPKQTYPGVICSIINAHGKPVFKNLKWKGIYSLEGYDGTKIWDSALRFKKGMFKKDFYCLSFHEKKHIPIGRGGMILTNDEKAYKWLKRARFDGRDQCNLKDDYFFMTGWNMYMTPEQAQKGLALFYSIKNKSLSDLPVEEQNYPDLSKWEIYTSGRR